MARSLNAPLSPHEEITLRRVALGVVDTDQLSKRDLRRLMDLQLVVRIDGRTTLTPLGQQRYDALPRASKIDLDRVDLPSMLEQCILHARRH